MKIKLSKNQWELEGKKAGWMKQASESGMMPGQTPYTPEEQKAVSKLISDAADEDPGEQNEGMALNWYHQIQENRKKIIDIMKRENVADADVPRRRTIKVTFSDGDHLNTDINGTVLSILKYYLQENPEQDYDLAHPERTRTVTDINFIG